MSQQLELHAGAPYNTEAAQFTHFKDYIRLFQENIKLKLKIKILTK